MMLSIKDTVNDDYDYSWIMNGVTLRSDERQAGLNSQGRGSSMNTLFVEKASLDDGGGHSVLRGRGRKDQIECQ
jgi:hypothetical protein